MKVLEFLLILAAFAAVVLVVTAPLRSGRTELAEQREANELAELEIAKESKYREIRDAEMDFRTGKLSRADHRALDRELRGEAIQLLRRIDALKPASPTPAAQAAEPAEADASHPDARVG